MKVILLGKGKMLANMIESARESGVEICGVFRHERTSLSKLNLFFHDLFATSHDLTLIKKYKLPEIKLKSANSEKFRNFVLKTNADIIMVGTWPEKLKKETFTMPKIGTVNLHPSLLPRFRGPNPYMQVILSGEKKSGITLHLVDENLDTGAILLQKEIDILPTDTSKELRERTFKASREIASEFFTKIQSEVIIPIQQNESRATYYGHINPDLKMLDFKNQTSEEIYATVRALHPWLPCYITAGKDFFKVNPYKIRIDKSILQNKAGEIIDKNENKKSLTIVCKDGRAITFDGLKIFGILKKPFTRFFINRIKTTK